MANPNVGTPDNTTNGGTQRTAIPASTGTANVKPAPGRLHRIIITSAPGAGSITAYDTGGADTTQPILGFVPASSTQLVFDFQAPALAGIYVVSAANLHGDVVMRERSGMSSFTGSVLFRIVALVLFVVAFIVLVGHSDLNALAFIALGLASWVLATLVP